MEKTLIILKPDCMESRHSGEVIRRFESSGFEIIACKMMQLDDAMLKTHYAHHAEKPYFPEIKDFMQRRPVLVLVLQGPEVIQRVRDLLGPTDSAQAPKGSIRGDLGRGKMENIAHASDSQESAAEEIQRFFNSQEVFELLK
jgi:nucleoside-diphosphate kinase